MAWRCTGTGALGDVLLPLDKKVTDFFGHEIELSIIIAFHAIKNITSDILSGMILEIQRSRTVYVYNEDEDWDREVLYLPYFEERESRKRRD